MSDAARSASHDLQSEERRIKTEPLGIEVVIRKFSSTLVEQDKAGGK
jgi:hypothetical protein